MSVQTPRSLEVPKGGRAPLTARLLRRNIRSPIGLDLGRRRAHAIQLERSTEGLWQIVAAMVLPRAAEQAVPVAEEVHHLYDSLDRQGFTGNDVILAAGPGLRASVLELPPLAGNAPLEQIARMELARTLRCPPDSFEMGCWDLPAPARAQKAAHVMAVALPHDDAEPLLDSFENESFNVCGLDVRACALARACRQLTDPVGVTAILDLGWGSAELVLLYRGAVIYGRSLADAGISRLHEALVGRLRVDSDVADYLISDVGLHERRRAQSMDADVPVDARGMIIGHLENMTRELQASFAYAVHQYPDAAVTRLLLVGGGADLPGIAEHLAGPLHMEVLPAAPAAILPCSPALKASCASAAFTAALGLALYPQL